MQRAARLRHPGRCRLHGQRAGVVPQRSPARRPASPAAALDEGLVPVCVYILRLTRRAAGRPGPRRSGATVRCRRSTRRCGARGSRLRCFVGRAVPRWKRWRQVATQWRCSGTGATSPRSRAGHAHQETLRRHGMRAHSSTAPCCPSPGHCRRSRARPTGYSRRLARGAGRRRCARPRTTRRRRSRTPPQGPDGVAIEARTSHPRATGIADYGTASRLAKPARARRWRVVEGAAHGYGRAATARPRRHLALSPHLHFRRDRAVGVGRLSKPAAPRPTPPMSMPISVSSVARFRAPPAAPFPGQHRRGPNPRFSRFRGIAPPAMLAAWQQGGTGVPIIDAGIARALAHRLDAQPRPAQSPAATCASTCACTGGTARAGSGRPWSIPTWPTTRWLAMDRRHRADASRTSASSTGTQSQRFDPDGAYIGAGAGAVRFPAALRHARGPPGATCARGARLSAASHRRPGRRTRCCAGGVPGFADLR